MTKNSVDWIFSHGIIISRLAIMTVVRLSLIEKIRRRFPCLRSGFQGTNN
jgi:hypothetical protein